MSLLAELKKRNVVRVGAAYAVIGWLVAQVAEFAFETFDAPDWVLKSLVIVLLLGLPVVLFIAWAFELTPDGIKPEKDVDRSKPDGMQAGRKLDRAIIGILLVAVALFAWDRFFSGTSDDAAATVASTTGHASARAAPGADEISAKSVAVLPFVAMSNGPDDGYFADGLTEEILNSLAALPELLVTARTSAFALKGKELQVQEIAELLGVQHIVEGSVRRSGGRLRVTAQLIRAADGFHLWSDTYDRDAGDSFAIQTDIAEKIAQALDVVLDDERRKMMAVSNVRNPEAFIAYHKGIELHFRAHNDLPQLPTLKRANTYFERAVELEPDFYNAHVAHADYFTHTLIDYATADPDVADLDQEALDEARRALEADLAAAIRSAPDPARRHNAEFDQALLLGNWRGLAGLRDRFLEKADDCAMPDWQHLVTAPFGKAADVLRDYAALTACDPLLGRTRVHRTVANIWLREFDRAIEVASAPNEDYGSWQVGTYVDALIAAGRLEDARAVIDTQVRHAGEALRYQARIVLMQGDAAEIAQLSGDAASPTGGVPGLIFAARRGDRETANTIAAFIDGRPFGYMPLLMAVYFCYCSAPFDLDATPTLAGMLDVSGLPWPPREVIDWPLKDW